MELSGGQLIGGGFKNYYLRDESLTLKEANCAVYVTMSLGASVVKLPEAKLCAGQFVLVFFQEAGLTESPFTAHSSSIVIQTNGSDRIMTVGTSVSSVTIDADREMYLLFTDGQYWFPCAKRIAS